MEEKVQPTVSECARERGREGGRRWEMGFLHRAGTDEK
jgi:hypothetical protein